jgi:hypothetical protein
VEKIKQKAKRKQKEKNCSICPILREGWKRQPAATGEDYSVQPDPKGHALYL